MKSNVKKCENPRKAEMYMVNVGIIKDLSSFVVKWLDTHELIWHDGVISEGADMVENQW